MTVSLTLEQVFADSKIEIVPSPESPYLTSNLESRRSFLDFTIGSQSRTWTSPDIPLYCVCWRPKTIKYWTEWNFAIDFPVNRLQLLCTGFLFPNELTFVGDGLYEFHIEVPEFGEWIIMISE